MEGSGRRFCVEPDTPYDPPCDQPQAYRGSSPSQAPNRAVASSYDGKEQGTSQQIEDIKERLLSCRWKPWRNRDPNCAFCIESEVMTRAFKLRLLHRSAPCHLPDEHDPIHNLRPIGSLSNMIEGASQNLLTEPLPAFRRMAKVHKRVLQIGGID